MKEVEPEKGLIAPGRALGYSITANLGDDRQIVVQCFADNDDPLQVIHGQLDKAMSVVDRQKAKYRKIEVEKSVEEMEKNLRRLKADLSAAETDFELQQKARNAAIAEIQNAAHARGRAAPVGSEAQRLNKLSEEVKRAVEERKFQRQNVATNIKRFEEEIAKAKVQIDECVALIEGG